METLVWTLYFVTRKYLDCMQYYTMPLEEFDHIVVKDLATVIWLGEDQIPAGLVTWLDYSFAFSKTISTLHFQLCRLLKQYVLHCTRYRVNWDEHN